MPGDHRRISGPADQTRPPLNEERMKEERRKQLSVGGKRQDGRTSDEVRKIFVRAGAVNQAKGSAYIEMGRTKIICSVYGPRESLRRQEFRMKDSEEKDLSNIITQALEPAVMVEKFPKAQIDIYVMVLENDGNVLAAAINCTTVALADAGIEMYDLVTACSLVHNKTDVLLDPLSTEEQSDRSCAVITVAFLPVCNQVSVLNMDGELSVKQTDKAMQDCIEGCARIYPVIYKCIAEHTRRIVQKPSVANVDRS